MTLADLTKECRPKKINWKFVGPDEIVIKFCELCDNRADWVCVCGRQLCNDHAKLHPRLSEYTRELEKEPLKIGFNKDSL